MESQSCCEATSEIVQLDVGKLFFYHNKYVNHSLCYRIAYCHSQREGQVYRVGLGQWEIDRGCLNDEVIQTRLVDFLGGLSECEAT